MSTIRNALALFALASTPAFAQQVTMIDRVPYSEDAEIQRKVRDECVKLSGQLADFTQIYAKKSGVDVTLVDAIDTAAPGRVLQVEITEAVSLGNPFIGHQKHSKVRGTLFEDGEKIASFKGLRTSMGGAFGGYKGSCSVLGRTMEALGKDIGAWLANPQDGAELGDL